MEVTRDNFEELLPAITDAIEEADFIGFDGEFSGLGVELAKFQHDSLEDRYKKLREGIRGFLILQVGLCPFKWVKEKQKYEARPFNFYIFPRPFGKHGENSRFACQCGSLEFLASNGFDFNKCIHKGVSFLLPYDEERLKEELELKYEKLKEDKEKEKAMEAAAKNSVSGSIQRTPIPLKFKSYVEDTCKVIKAFIENKDEKTLDLAPASGLKRKLIYEAVESRFPSGIYLESCPSNKGKFLRVVKGSAEEKRDVMEDRRSKDKVLLDTAIGFSKVMRLIQKSGKLLVGHNMLLDVMLSVNQFFAPLPDTLKDFKVLTNTVFPRLVDTKLIACTSPLKDFIASSVLIDLKDRMSKSPFTKPAIEIADGFDRYTTSDSKCHEAGYDAYITGYSFVGLACYLTKAQNMGKHDSEFDKVKGNTAVMELFVNKINITRLSHIPYMSIDGDDPIPNRGHVFCVQCASSWSTGDIVNLFSPYGFVFISWVNEKTALVALDKAEKSNDVIRELVAFYETKSYRVITYAQYTGKEDLEKYQDKVNVPSKKKKRSKSAAKSDTSGLVEVKQAKLEPSEPNKRESDPEDGEIMDSDSEGNGHINKTVIGSSVPNNEPAMFEIPGDW